MLFLSIVRQYLLWHYTRAFFEIFHVWLNIIWFTIHFFSITRLVRSWIAPWKRTVENRGEKWNLEDLAGYVLIGLVSRVVGFILRTSVIIVGLFSLTVVVIGGLAVYAIWTVLPLTIIGMFVFGSTLLIA